MENPSKQKATKKMTSHKIEIGSGDQVEIIKMFGPTVFADLRITADYQRGCWVIERCWIKDNIWIEWCTIPNQIQQEFSED